MANIVIKNTDALSYLNEFEENTFDLIILDPDYQDWVSLLNEGIIEKCMMVLKDTGNILCFTKQPFDYELRIAVNPYFRREIVWTFDNGGAWCSNKLPLVSAQKIYWLVKDKNNFYFNPRTGVPYPETTKNFKRSKKVFGDYEADGRDFCKSEEGLWLRDHLHYNKPSCGKIPAKPDELIKIFLKCFCPENGTVLDPFAGSGVVLFQGKELGLNVYACELNEDRAKDINNRLA